MLVPPVGVAAPIKAMICGTSPPVPVPKSSAKVVALPKERLGALPEPAPVKSIWLVEAAVVVSACAFEKTQVLSKIMFVSLRSDDARFGVQKCIDHTCGHAAELDHRLAGVFLRRQQHIFVADRLNIHALADGA